MGETQLGRLVRTIGVAVTVVGTVTVLASCSQLGAAPGAQPSSTGDVVDPSIPSASPTEVVASPDPVLPTGSASATPASTTPADTRTAVVPFITTADWDAKAKALDVSAIVPNVVEGDGTCTVTVSQGDSSRTATSPGVAASSYTGCQAVAISGLAAGTWQVRVRYSSAKAAGASAVRTVQVG